VKKLFILVIMAGVVLAGCEEGTIVYDGKQRPVSEVEEIIADKLEVENPGMDLEISIYEETED
jgi:hypothetical protein